MSYNLKIGELITRIEYDGLESYIDNNVVDEKHENAPAFGEPTDKTNNRWPAYLAWHETMQFLGLEDFMYNEQTGLLREHSGCFPLVKEHKEILDKAYKEFYEKYPNCKAGYPKDSKDENWPIENCHAVRLEWLKYWVDWALDNCKCPVFYNS